MRQEHPIFWAIINDDWKAVQKLIIEDPKCLSKKIVTDIKFQKTIPFYTKRTDRVTLTPLMYAFVYKKPNIVRILLTEDGIDPGVNIQNEHGWSAIHYAAACGYPAYFFELMIKKGGDINLKNTNNGTAILLAALNEKKHVVQYLIDQGAEIDHRFLPGMSEYALHERKKLGISADWLLGHGSFVNEENRIIYQTAHLLVQNDKDVIQKIIEENPKCINVFVNDNEETLLMNAIRTKNDVLAEVLIKSDTIDLTAKTKIGFDTLFYAILYGNLKIVKLLVEKGMDVNEKNGVTQLTPLFVAAYENKKDIVEYLIECGAEIDYENPSGDSLYGVLKEGKLSMSVAWIVQKGNFLKEETKEKFLKLAI